MRAQIWRFYLLYIRPETQDSAFKWSDLAAKTNSELLANLGNFINRSLMFLVKNFDARLPPWSLGDADCTFVAQVTRLVRRYCDLMDNVKLRDGLRTILAISHLGNQYLQSQAPWKLIKKAEQRARAASVTAVAVQLVYSLAALMEPFMPSVAARVCEQLAAPPLRLGAEPAFAPYLPPGHAIGTVRPLFAELSAAQIEALRLRFAGTQAQAAPVATAAPRTPMPM